MNQKTAYNVQMSFTVPDAEKRMAEKAAELFNDLSSQLKLSLNHLNIMYIPFKKYQEFDSQELLQHRRALRRYRDQVQLNFNKILAMTSTVLKLMHAFSTDTQISDLMNAFLAHIADLKKQVNRFLGLFSNIGSVDFIGASLTSIEYIKKEISQLKQLINDRILAHLDTNILAKHWTTDTSGEYQEQAYEKVPLIIQLFKERQEAVG